MAENAKSVDDSSADEEERRQQILEAALECFSQLGIAKTSVNDVARAAGVSRGTVYRYFGDRQVLIDETVDFGARRYYGEVAQAMSRQATLAKQVGAMAEIVAQTLVEHRLRDRLMSDDHELLRRVITDGDASVRRTTHFLGPYVDAAKKRGEVAKSIDTPSASEWLARVIHSLSTVQASPTFDTSKPKAVSRFVERFAVNGLDS